MITVPPDMHAWWDALPADLPADHLTLVVGVLEALDSIDYYADTAPSITADWAPGAAAIVRIALHTHSPDDTATCTDCTPPRRGHAPTGAPHTTGSSTTPRPGAAHADTHHQVVSPW